MLLLEFELHAPAAAKHALHELRSSDAADTRADKVHLYPTWLHSFAETVRELSAA